MGCFCAKQIHTPYEQVTAGNKSNGNFEHTNTNSTTAIDMNNKYKRKDLEKHHGLSSRT